MSAFEMWTCDKCCSNGPEEEGDVVMEDEARDRGWKVYSRRVPYEFLPADSKAMRTEYLHVCDQCVQDLKNPDEPISEWVNHLGAQLQEWV